MEKNILDLSDLIPILNLLASYKQEWNSNGIQEGTTMWCITHFITKSAVVSLASVLYLENQKTSDKNAYSGKTGTWFSKQNQIIIRVSISNCINIPIWHCTMMAAYGIGNKIDTENVSKLLRSMRYQGWPLMCSLNCACEDNVRVVLWYLIHVKSHCYREWG